MANDYAAVMIMFFSAPIYSSFLLQLYVSLEQTREQ